MDTFLTDQLIRSWRGPAGSYQADPSEADPTQPLTKLPLLFKTSETTKGAEHELCRRMWVGGRYMSVIHRQDPGKLPSVSCTVQYTMYYSSPSPTHSFTKENKSHEEFINEIYRTYNCTSIGNIIN